MRKFSVQILLYAVVQSRLVVSGSAEVVEFYTAKLSLYPRIHRFVWVDA